MTPPAQGRAEPIVVGIDLGGTRLRAGASGADRTGPVHGRIVELGHTPAPTNLAQLAAALGSILRRAGERGTVVGVGLTVPGLVVGSTCVWVPNLGYLDGVDVTTLVATGASEPALAAGSIAVGNDAHLAMLAEAAEGAASDRHDALLLAIGTGIGSAVLSGGRIQRGNNGAACSFGWACADVADGGDDRLGWLERHAAGPVLDAAGALMVPPRRGAAVVDAAMSGEPDARSTLDAMGTALGTALAGAVALLDPGLVIIIGGVAAAVDELRPALRAALDRHLPPHLRGIEVVAGRFGPAAGLVGALHAARRGERWWEVRA